MSSVFVSTRQQRFACARLPDPHLTRHARLFHIAHHDHVTDPAACGGLKPPPAGRLRRADNPSSPAQHRISKLYLHRTPFRVRDTPPDEPLFWVAGTRSFGDRRDGEYPQYVIRARHLGGDNSLNRLIQRYRLAISEPHDMRRLRKTVKSARAALLGTLNGAAGDDHCVEVFRGHYAHTTTVHTIAAQTVLRAQRKVLDRASRGPTFVDAKAADIAAGPRDSDLAALAMSVAEESPAEQQLTLSACRDPYDAPFGQPGSLCHASPSMCLQCRNAVIFRDHLPRLIVYRDVLDDIEKTMPPIPFREVYGQQGVNIDAILAEFPAEQIKAARRQNAHLHRPLGQRAEQ
jgi:hypothetical protein